VVFILFGFPPAFLAHGIAPSLSSCKEEGLLPAIMLYYVLYLLVIVR
jgi:hypothetical protein